MMTKRYLHNASRRFRAQSTVLSLSICICLLSSSPAIACGVCTTALVDRMLPPVGLWSLFAIIWFLVLAFLVAIRRERISGVPSAGAAIVLVISLSFIGLHGLGPVGLLLLLVSPLCVSVQTFVGKHRLQWSQALVRDLKVISSTGIIVLIGLSAYSAYIQLVRSPAAYAIQWTGTLPARMVLSQYEKPDPATLPDVRYLVAHGQPKVVQQVVGHIGVLGQPEKDVPLLLLAFGQCRGAKDCERDVSAALRQITGLNLSDETSAKSWQEHWHRHRHQRHPL